MPGRPMNPAMRAKLAILRRQAQGNLALKPQLPVGGMAAPKPPMPVAPMPAVAPAMPSATPKLPSGPKKSKYYGGY